MPIKRRKSGPKVKTPPAPRKSVRIASDPSSLDHETVVWRFSIVDLDGSWGWRTAAARRWWANILPKLQNFESMTWAELFSAAGGRRAGNNHHPVKVEKLTKQAKIRLHEIRQDDVSDIFSLRLSGTERIYGIRDGRALKLIWYDEHHGDNARAVYPTIGAGN